MPVFDDFFFQWDRISFDQGCAFGIEFARKQDLGMVHYSSILIYFVVFQLSFNWKVEAA